MNEYWAFSEKPALLAEMIGGANALAAQSGGMSAAIVLGSRAEAEKAVSLGVGKVYWLGEKLFDRLVDDYLPTLLHLARSNKPALILISSTRRGRAIAGRLAAGLGTSAVTDAREITRQGAAFQMRHMIFGGGAVRQEQPDGDIAVATIGQGVYESPAVDGAKSCPIVDVSFVEPTRQIKFIERREKKITSVNLAAAKKVVCPGLGIGKQEDLALIADLAQTLGAEIGCTRPLAEGLAWYPRERYIGVSGASLKADLYIGIGVSGQVQHTVGITDSRVIVAINKDKNAAIFPQADYGVAADLYTFLPALINAVKARG